jgi:hypothetical protein
MTKIYEKNMLELNFELKNIAISNTYQKYCSHYEIIDLIKSIIKTRKTGMCTQYDMYFYIDDTDTYDASRLPYNEVLQPINVTFIGGLESSIGYFLLHLYSKFYIEDKTHVVIIKQIIQSMCGNEVHTQLLYNMFTIDRILK